MASIRLMIHNNTGHKMEILITDDNKADKDGGYFEHGEYYDSDGMPPQTIPSGHKGGVGVHNKGGPGGYGPKGYLDYTIIDDGYKKDKGKYPVIRLFFRRSQDESQYRYYRVFPLDPDYFYGDMNNTVMENTYSRLKEDAFKENDEKQYYDDYADYKKQKGTKSHDYEVTFEISGRYKPSVFYVVSDLHFGRSSKTDTNAKTVCDRMRNDIAEEGMNVLGVIANGDMTHDGSGAGDFYEQFIYQNQGKYSIRCPVYEGFGNHDEDDVRKYMSTRNTDIEARRWQKNISEKNNDKRSHYSWEWQGVRFIHLNRFPGTGNGHPSASGGSSNQTYSYESFAFLEYELASTKQSTYFALVFHFGLEEDLTKDENKIENTQAEYYNNQFWNRKDREDFWRKIEPYKDRILAIFTGHVHYKYKEEAKERPVIKYKFRGIQCYGTGGDENHLSAKKFSITTDANQKPAINYIDEIH